MGKTAQSGCRVGAWRRGSPWPVAATVVTLLCMLVSGSCGGDGRSGIANSPAGPGIGAVMPAAGETTTHPDTASPQPGQLNALLAAELSRRGIDPKKTVSSAPTGEANRVFDLRARLVEPDPPGSGEPVAVELTWTEVLIGDYNQDGVVNATDLTPLGQYYQSIVDYDDPAQHDGIAHWPSGDPDGDGALNWRLARIDGNHDRLIELGDITPIAQHWGERLDGYRVYRKGPGEDEFSMVMDPEDQSAPLTLPREMFTPAGGVLKPVRYRWICELPLVGDSWFYIAPWSDRDAVPGSASQPVSVHRNLEPVAQLSWSADEETGHYTVDFSAAASYDPDGWIASYEWDLDNDGTFELDSGIEPDISHSFSSPGSYCVAVRVSDDSGATAIAARGVFVGYDFHAGFSIDDPVGKEPHRVRFDPSASWSSRGIVLCEWDFDGDGITDMAAADPTVQEHTYMSSGEYPVILTITETGGAQAQASDVVTVIDSLYVSLDATIEKGLTPFNTAFLAKVYLAQDGASFDWDLDGDGEFEIIGSSESVVSHVYEVAGEHTIQVRATDGLGFTDTAATMVKACQAPTAEIRPLTEILQDNRSCQLSAYPSFDPDGEIVEYWWDMESTGNWLKSYNGWSPKHQYLAGDYIVSLRVVDDDGYSSAVTSMDIHVVSMPKITLESNESPIGDGMQVDFQVETDVSADFTIERLWIHCGDGETIEFGSASFGSASYGYPQGSYVYYACLLIDTGYLICSEHHRIDPGGGLVIPDGLPVLVIRDDGGVYSTNYDAVIADLNEIGRSYTEVDYYPGISGDYTCQDHSPVIWYRGGPGNDEEPQVYTTPWTADEIDDYLVFPRSGNRLLLMSQSHGINDDGYGYPCTGWEGYFGWEILPGSIPDGDPRHPWAPGATLEPGCAATGTFGFLKMSPRNLKVTTALSGRYRRSNFGYTSDSAERFSWVGSSGKMPGDLEFGQFLQVCGMGFSYALQEERYGEGFVPGVSTDPEFEGTWDMAYLSWGCRGNAPFENTGFWPPPYNFKPGTGSLWIVGYPWASTKVKYAQIGDDMSRADLLHNILGWLEWDQDG